MPQRRLRPDPRCAGRNRRYLAALATIDGRSALARRLASTGFRAPPAPHGADWTPGYPAIHAMLGWHRIRSMRRSLPLTA